MEQVILIKPTQQKQLAHLYEHLYYDALVLYFREQNLLSYLDYSLHATTRDDFVHIEINLYTPKAETLAQHLHDLDVTVNEQSVKRAFIEVMAEKERNIESAYPDLPPIIAQLKELHIEAWKNAEDAMSVTPAGKKPRQILTVTKERVPVKSLRCELKLENDFIQTKQELLPLFFVVARVLHDNLMDELSIKYGYYFVDSSRTYTKHIVEEVNTYTALEAAVPQLTNEKTTCKKLVAEMLKNDLVRSTSRFLSNLTHSTPQAAPDEIRIYEATGQLVGAAGWRKIATEENILEVLKHASLQLVYGKEKQDLEISRLLV